MNHLKMYFLLNMWICPCHVSLPEGILWYHLPSFVCGNWTSSSRCQLVVDSPLWKICLSNWIISPRIGVKTKNIWVATTQDVLPFRDGNCPLLFLVNRSVHSIALYLCSNLERFFQQLYHHDCPKHEPCWWVILSTENSLTPIYTI